MHPNRGEERQGQLGVHNNGEPVGEEREGNDVLAAFAGRGCFAPGRITKRNGLSAISIPLSPGCPHTAFLR